jgi:hypothetical protein
MPNQPRPRAIFSSFGLFIPFRRPSPAKSISDHASRVICFFAIFPLYQKFIPRASDLRFGHQQKAIAETLIKAQTSFTVEFREDLFFEKSEETFLIRPDLM